MRAALTVLIVLLAGCDLAIEPGPRVDEESPGQVRASSDGAMISIPTAPPMPLGASGRVECDLAVFGGRVMSHPIWGIALSGDEGVPVLTRWPHGYVGRVAGNRLELLDGNGQVIARTGDHLQAAGGFTTIDGQEGFNVCPVGLVVAPGPPP